MMTMCAFYQWTPATVRALTLADVDAALGLMATHAQAAAAAAGGGGRG